MILAAPLVRSTVRAVHWWPVAAATLFTLGIAVATDPGPTADTRTYAVTLRISALVLGAAAGFLLVDELTESAVVAPMPRWLPQWTRTLLAMGAAALAWIADLLVLSAGFPDGTDLGRPGLALEAAVLILGSLACTAVAVRRRPEASAAVAAAAVMFVLAVLSLPYRDVIWPTPGDPSWSSVHLVWLPALLVPLCALGLANREIR